MFTSMAGGQLQGGVMFTSMAGGQLQGGGHVRQHSREGSTTWEVNDTGGRYPSFDDHADDTEWNTTILVHVTCERNISGGQSTEISLWLHSQRHFFTATSFWRWKLLANVISLTQTIELQTWARETVIPPTIHLRGEHTQKSFYQLPFCTCVSAKHSQP